MAESTANESITTPQSNDIICNPLGSDVTLDDSKIPTEETIENKMIEDKAKSDNEWFFKIFKEVLEDMSQAGDVTLDDSKIPTEETIEKKMIKDKAKSEDEWFLKMFKQVHEDNMSQAGKMDMVAVTLDDNTNPTEDKDKSEEEMFLNISKQALRDMYKERGMSQEGIQEEFIEKVAYKIAEAINKVFTSNDGPPTTTSEYLSETVKYIHDGLDTTQIQIINADELSHLLLNIGLNMGKKFNLESAIDSIPPQFFKIGKSELTKDLHYLPLKKCIEKGQEELQKIKDSLSAEDYETYSKQLDLPKKIIEEFDSERESDSEEIQLQRVKIIIKYYMQLLSLMLSSEVFCCTIIKKGEEEISMQNVPQELEPKQ